MTTLNAYHASVQTPDTSPELERLVTEIIARVADKWTMLVIEELHEHGDLRFGQLQHLCEGISPKMLTQTLRAMEQDGLVSRTIYPEIPPKVVYALTDLGLSLGAAFCGVWKWAAANRTRIEEARAKFAEPK